MRFPEHKYDRQGMFPRADGSAWWMSRIVRTIAQSRGRVDVRTGLPLEIWLVDDVGSYYEAPIVQTIPNMDGVADTYIESFEHRKGTPLVIRTPDDVTPDVLMIIPPGGLNNQGAIQYLSDGSIARWLMWREDPPRGQVWMGLWRIEHRDGKIERLLRLMYENRGATQRPYFLAEDGKDGRIMTLRDGRTALVDGGERAYAIIDGTSMFPLTVVTNYMDKGTATQFGPQWNTKHRSDYGGINNHYDERLDAGWCPYVAWPQNDALSKLVSLATLSDSMLINMKPSMVLQVYYNVGQWIEDGEVKSGTCTYTKVTFKSGLVEYEGFPAFLLGHMTRQRLWRLRPDLKTVMLSNGTVVPALIDPALFPPLDGMLSRRLKCKNDWAKWVHIAGTVLMGIATAGAPFMVQLASLGFDAGQSFLQAMEGQKGLAKALERVEAGEKLATTVKDVERGIEKVILVDAPEGTRELNDRAAGRQPTQFDSSNNVMLLAMIAAALAALALA